VSGPTCSKISNSAPPAWGWLQRPAQRVVGRQLRPTRVGVTRSSTASWRCGCPPSHSAWEWLGLDPDVHSYQQHHPTRVGVTRRRAPSRGICTAPPTPVGVLHEPSCPTDAVGARAHARGSDLGIVPLPDPAKPLRPTSVGVPPCIACSPRYCLAQPHLRGGDSVTSAPGVKPVDSGPRPWEWLGLDPDVHSYQQHHPTRVGMPRRLAWRSCPSATPSHPRGGGSRWRWLREATPSPPPHAWG
jgi:hypothetical protein